ncbi:MAG: DUF2191 domain-containing protein [Acidobacteriota bacterium]
MLLCIRTTIEINDDLFRHAKKKAADEGGSLRSVVENALRQYLAARLPAEPFELRWRAERGKLQPGVNLDDRDALFDLMEGRN